MGIWRTITERGASFVDAATRLGTFDVERDIEAPAEVVWDILVDVDTWPDWGPSVADVELDEPRLYDEARGRVLSAAGIWMSFEVTEWDEGARWVWDVEGVRATGHRVEVLDEQRCRLVFEVPTVAAPYAFVCRRAANTIARMAEDGVWTK